MMERVLGWALSITLAVLLLIVVYQSLMGPTPNAIFGMVALRSGIHAVEPFGRYAVAAMQIVAVVMVVTVKLRIWHSMLRPAVKRTSAHPRM